jgi:ribA/ribD-fused uncharacterized protein
VFGLFFYIKESKMIESFSGEYRWLSNFVPCNVVLDGVIYPSTENAYQASKTTVKEERIFFESCTSGQAKRHGAKHITLRKNWVISKLYYMEDFNRQKYDQEPFTSLLLNTGNMMIVEGNTWGDTYWGVCNGIGSNVLGNIIMKVRENLILHHE